MLVFCAAACSRSDEPAKAAPGADPGEARVNVLFTYGSEKQTWIEESTAAFNQARRRTSSGKVIRVEAIPIGSGESVEEMLSGRRQAHLTSPASAAFIKLGNAESRAKTGKDLVGATQKSGALASRDRDVEADGRSARVGQRADRLGGRRRTRAPARGLGRSGHPEWGRFRFGHTHPGASNSGLISLLAETYAGAGKVGGLTLDDVRGRNERFVEGVEQAVVHYGSSTGFFGRKMFANGPSYLSAAVLYENMVIESCDPKIQRCRFRSSPSTRGKAPSGATIRSASSSASG